MSETGLLIRASAPGGPVTDHSWWFDTTTGNTKRWDGSNWVIDGGLGGPVSVDTFGANPSASAAANTTAFNDALVDGRPIFVPYGTYNLNALTAVSAPIRLFGCGRGSKLIFNTTGVGIEIEDISPDQSKTYLIHDLAFDNDTNTPAAFILNQYAVNSRFWRLYFDHCTVTRCIDVHSGYGAKISDCIFSDVTGDGVRFRHLYNTDEEDYDRYTINCAVRDTDFTRVSGTAIDIEGAIGLTVEHAVIESCNRGIWGNSLGGGTTPENCSWNVKLDNVHFEGNTTADIEFEANDQYQWGHCTLIGTYFSTPTDPAIQLNGYGQLAVIGCNQSSGDPATVDGGTNAKVVLVNSAYVTAGTFTGQWYDTGTYYDAAGTPSWAASSSNPTLGNGTLTSRWSRNGHRATLDLYLKPGSTTSFGTGTYLFGDALLTSVPATNQNEAAGVAMLYDASGAYEAGIPYFTDDHTLVIATASGLVTPSVPWTWAQDDQIRLSITYQC